MGLGGTQPRSRSGPLPQPSPQPRHALPTRGGLSPWTPGHTHWFNSRSRVRVGLEAGIMSSPGPDGQAGERREGRRESTWEAWRQELGGQKGNQGTGSSPGEGMAQPQQLWGPLIWRRCFPQAHLPPRPCPFLRWRRGQAWASIGTDLPALWVPAQLLSGVGASLGPVYRSSREDQGSLACPLPHTRPSPSPICGRATPTWTKGGP